MKKISKNYNSILRSKAEEYFKSEDPGKVIPVEEFETLKLISELEVHQIELMMQNDELALAKSEAQKKVDEYKELYDFAPLGYVSISRSGNIEKLNLTFSRMLQKERLKILNNPFMQYVTDETKAAFVKFLDDIFKKNEKTACDIVLSNDINQDIHVHIEGILSEDRQCCNAALTDKTSEFHAIKQLNATVHLNNLILKGAGEGIMGIDRNGNHMFVNPMVSELLGYTEEELLGKSSHELYHDRYPDGTIYPIDFCPINKAVISGKSFLGMEYFWHRNGNCFPVELNCLPIFDDDEMAGTVVTFRDITDRKIAENELLASYEIIKQSEADLKKAQSVAHLGSWKWDVINGKVTWSDEMYKIFGINKIGYSGRLGDEIAKVVHPDDLYLVLPSNAESFTKKKPIEYRIVLSDNSIRYISAESGENITDKNGNLLFLTGIAQDITERKMAEEELSVLNAHLEERIKDRTSQLIAVNKEVEAFAYSVSHDLRAPLRHISGFVGMLQELDAPYRSEEEMKYLNIISKGADEMGKLIDAILSFSKLQRTDVKKTTIRTTLLVNSVIGFMNEDIKERKIDFRIGNLPDCMGDEQLIKLVWINLISNAIKYTSKISEAEIEIGSIYSESENIYFIRDNGVGFDMQYAGKLFGVFQRLHHQRDFEGIGIGLANVNSIISRHGGICRAEGEVDKGAAFYFSLPK